VWAAKALVATDPQRFVLVYEDELTYYHRPSVAQGYVLANTDAPRADQGWGSKCWKRVAASLNVSDGQLIYWQRSAFDAKTMLGFYQTVEAAYPKAEVVYMALDNWRTHFQADIVSQMASKGSKLVLLSLPTYAPWTNPVEKVWRKLYAEVLHLHEQVNDWPSLQASVQEWLEQYSNGSTSLLRYVGLYPD
jgi:transposase